MPRYVAFLRAINVGKRRVQMTDLAAALSVDGFEDVKTHIASGNVVFTHASGDTQRLEQEIEALLRNALGYEVETFVRTGAEIVGALRAARAAGAELPDHHGVYVNFTYAPIDTAHRQALLDLNVAPDIVAFGEREWIWVAAASMAKAPPLGTPKAFKALGAPSTGRNVTMLEKLLAKHELD